MTDTKQEKKSIDVFVIYPETPTSFVRTGQNYCVAFDFGNPTQLGIGVKDSQTAAKLAQMFMRAAKLLKAKESILHMPKRPEIIKP